MAGDGRRPPQLSCMVGWDPYTLPLLSPRPSSVWLMLVWHSHSLEFVKEESPPDPFQGREYLLTYKVLSAGFDYL